MSKLTEIEAAIIQLGPGEFQKFCDAFLRRNYIEGAILGLGMKTGTLKTTIGNPDTYLVNEDGKYVFVVYTTQQVSIKEKIQEDIEKCLNPEKTGVQTSDIEEIICCHTSSNLIAGDDQKLRRMCSAYGVKLTLRGVDEIAEQLYRDDPILARDFLGISLDTNQIMPAEEFVKQYDSSEMVAPLDTKFQGRDKKLNELLDAIRASRVVIIHGPAGVGKTRIALEAGRILERDDHYHLLCVKSNHLNLYDDLVSCMKKEEKYLFFVDDADLLSRLNLIVERTKKSDQNCQVKVILTVRDYAKQGVIFEARKFTEPTCIEIPPFSDEEMEKFLADNLQITNIQLTDQIMQIAEGNPRVAYMAGRLAKEKHSLTAVYDATAVYEQYYQEVIDQKLGDDFPLCFTMGVLALIRAVALDRLEDLKPLMKLGKVSEDEFVSSIRRLSKMEFVEIHQDKVAAISDQCMANYMLYYEFFQEKRIPFADVLAVGFKHFRKDTVQSANMLMHLFSREDVRQYIEAEVKSCRRRFEQDHDDCSEEFIKVFHVFWPEDAFLAVLNKINQIQQEPYSGEIIQFDKGIYANNDDCLEYFTGYEHSSHIQTVVELLLQYAGKSAACSRSAFGWMKNHLGIDSTSYRYHYDTINQVAGFISKNIPENGIARQFVIAFCGYALGFAFSPMEAGRGNSVRIYNFQILNCDAVRKYRALCWQTLKELAKDSAVQEAVRITTWKYTRSVRGAKDDGILADDLPHVQGIIETLRCSSLKKAEMISRLQNAWDKHGISYIPDTKYCGSDEWKLALLLENQGKSIGNGYKERQKECEKQLLDYAAKLEPEDVEIFLDSASQIYRSIEDSDTKDKYAVASHVDYIIGQLCRRNGFARKVLNSFTQRDMPFDIHSGCVLRALFDKQLPPDEIWSTLAKIPDSNRNKWQFSFFEELPAGYVDSKEYQRLMDFLEDDSDRYLRSYRDLHFLDTFLIIDANVYVTATKVIFKKRSYSSFTVEMYLELLFSDQNYSPEELQSLFAADPHFLQVLYMYMLGKGIGIDYQGTFLLDFLSEDDTWLDAYAEELVQEAIKAEKISGSQFKALWLADDYMKYYNAIFDKVAETLAAGYISNITEFYRKVLSCGDDLVIRERQEKWVIHTVDRYALDDKIIQFFTVITGVDEGLRLMAFCEFLARNDNFDVFKRLPLYDGSWGGPIDEWPLLYKKCIEFLQSLLSELHGVKFLKHAQLIHTQIDSLQKEAKREEEEQIYRNLKRQWMIG